MKIRNIVKGRSIIVTGGAGFIGSHVVRRLVERYPSYRIICLDCLTYAGNLSNLSDISSRANYRFAKMDICDTEGVARLMREEKVDGIIHLAAESHVDRSIEDPLSFARTNVLGTLSMLQAARTVWQEREEGFEGKRFYHISTDEVFGALELGDTQKFNEEMKYAPHSPYSASKASADHFVRAFADTYGMPVVISNCSNNFGPNQFPEKLIPLVVNNIKHRRDIPVYGTGDNVRDWLYVEDHASAIDAVFHRGVNGQTYCIGGGNELSNIELVRKLIAVTDRLLGRAEGEDEALIRFVADRKGHDKRYAIDSSKISRELGWQPETGLEEGLEKTVRWYLENGDWLEGVTSGEYVKYYDRMYSGR